MENETFRSEKKAVILNGKKGNLVTTYHLKPGALGDFGWHKHSVAFERKNEDLKAEKEYSIEAKETAKLKGKSVTIFQVFEYIDNSRVYVGTFNVSSRGVARDATCLKAWLTNEY